MKKKRKGKRTEKKKKKKKTGSIGRNNKEKQTAYQVTT